MSRERSLGPEGGDQWRQRSEAAVLGLGTGRYTTLGRRRDARRSRGGRPGGRRGRRSSPGCPSRWKAGQCAPETVPPGPALLTDTEARRSPCLNRKPAGAVAGPRGAPRAPFRRAPDGSLRARSFLARPLPLARPVSARARRLLEPPGRVSRRRRRRKGGSGHVHGAGGRSVEAWKGKLSAEAEASGTRRAR